MLTDGQTISEDLGIKLENVTLDMLGRAKRVSITKDNTTIIDGAGKKKDDRGARRPDQGADRGDDLRLRQGEAAGAAGQARGRRCGDQGRRRHRGRGEGAQGPRRRRAQRHPRGGRGRHRAGRRRHAARRPQAPSPSRATTRTRTPASTSSSARCSRRSARSPRTPASKARSWSARCSRRVGLAFGYDAQNDEYGDMFEKGIIDPAKVVRIALQDAASIAGLMITTEAGVAEAPKKDDGAGHSHGRRHGRDGRHGHVGSPRTAISEQRDRSRATAGGLSFGRMNGKPDGLTGAGSPSRRRRCSMGLHRPCSSVPEWSSYPVR